MSLVKRRSRLVSFRLSEDEYKGVERACLAEGRRSVADFARMSVLAKIAALNAPQGLLSGDLATLSSRLNELNDALEDVRGRIGRVLGTAK